MAHDDRFDDIATSCRHEYAHYEDEMFRDSFDPEVLLRAADEIERLQTENAFLKKALVRYGCEYVDIVSAVTEWGDNE